MKTKRTAPVTSTDEPSDGRAARSARSRRAIADAVYELVRARGAMPSVEEVAARAGVGERTVFRQFNDLDELARSVHERLFPEVIALSRGQEPTGDLAEDVGALVARRARVFEHIAPFRRASRGHRERSPFITDRDAAMAAMMRATIESVLSPHLSEAQRDLVEIIDVLLSFEAWDRLRTVQKLTAERAESALRTGALAMLAGAHRPCR